MSDTDFHQTRPQIQEILDHLRDPIPDLSTLLALLTAPLGAIGLLPPRFINYNTRPLHESLRDHNRGGLDIRKHIPQVQRILLSHIVPTWTQILQEEKGNSLVLVDQYFCPDGFVNARHTAGDVALAAYSTLVSPGILLTGGGEYGLNILARLTVEYPMDRLYRAVFHGGDWVLTNAEWDDCVRDICKVPAVVANVISGKFSIPDVLENGAYFNRMSLRCEELFFTLAEEAPSQEPIACLVAKLVNLGVFPPHPPVARSQPSFFQSTLLSLRSRLSYSDKYAQYWSSLFRYIASSSSLTLQSVMASLLGNLHISEEPSLTQDTSYSTRARVKHEAKFLHRIVGSSDTSSSGDSSLWQILTSLIVNREWPEFHARIFVAWMSGASSDVNTKGAFARSLLNLLDSFLETVLDVWTSPEHVKHSVLSRHRYMTSLLLLTISYFPPTASSIQDMVSLPQFISSISIYISHLDPSVRRCGMLVAEVVAHLCDKKLNFGPWDGDGEGKPWCRALRELLKSKDVDVPEATDVSLDDEVEEVATEGAAKLSSSVDPTPARATFITKDDGGYDSDDSMVGYASPSMSSRSSSPSPSDLGEIEKDPTLNVGLKKVPRPVYLAQLGDLLRGTGTKMQTGPNDAHEADRIEMALNCAEELIRRKQGYGTELDENAVNLVYALLSLQDNFDLEGFSEKRQGAMTVLVACAPRKAPLAIIQEFFKNQYSTDQRFVALNALAIGARELASLPIPPSRVKPERTTFPSKMLPGPLHRKYISDGDDRRTSRDMIPLLVEDLASHALAEHAEEAERATSSPAFIRERRLRVQKPQRVTEIPSSSTLNPYTSQPAYSPSPITDTKFIDVAAEFFVLPLISSFWAFLRDEQTREANTAHRTGRARYKGAGTGLILNPLVLSQMVRTLAIMVHASRNAREWMATMAPEALEVAVTIGTRPISHIDDDDDDEEKNQPSGQGPQPQRSENSTSKEASLLTSTLELALVVLDGALELDGGRILGLEHTALVMGVGEWAGKVFAGLEKGLRVQGGGGVHEAKLSRTAAGVLIKVDQLSSRWSRSMIDNI